MSHFLEHKFVYKTFIFSIFYMKINIKNNYNNMIYIDSSTIELNLFISKHQEPEHAVNFELEYCLDNSAYVSADVSVHENYYVYNLDSSSMKPGQYEYRIIDSATGFKYESGLLYKQSDIQTDNQNLSDITYERD